ncbi:DUF1326 domain-containing protein [Natrinema zhouii]|uniref:DUF1326 domain-containing protein n=1 Tax=Natrinema zhouii TaxID=1710539 RepID=A0A7D6GNV8_9EURY|nr:DUF1326 domain-containing protein [Natrinema zhouii]QLK24602.1 DUF1326 domain-containing protein [Natrinema zhouii]
MAEQWQLEGDYVEACNCDVTCQCIWLEPPDDNVCTVSLVWHIRDGRYGDIDLSDLSVGMLVSTETGVMFAPDTGWNVVLLIDEAADDDQRAALEDIYFGRAGGIFAPVADTHVESAEVATVPVTFDRNGADLSVEMGDVVSMAVVGKRGFNEDLGTISPHPLTKSREMQTGKSTTATVTYDDEFSWDVSENNSYFGDFELANA